MVENAFSEYYDLELIAIPGDSHVEAIYKFVTSKISYAEITTLTNLTVHEDISEALPDEAAMEWTRTIMHMGLSNWGVGGTRAPQGVAAWVQVHY